MPRFSRSALGFVCAAVTAGVVGFLAAPRVVATAEPSTQGDWKTVLPEAEMLRLVDDCVKYLQGATKSETELKVKAGVAEQHAYVLILAAQAGLDSGGEMAKKAAFLQETAVNLAAGIAKFAKEEKKPAREALLKDAQGQVAQLAKFKTMKPTDEPKNANPAPLNEAIPIGNLMKEVRDTDKKLQEYKRLSQAAFTAKGKPEEITTMSHRMATLTMGITAHVPEKDPDPKEKDKDKQLQTRKLWLESTAECRDATLELAAAAKAKKAKDFKDAYAKMDTACNRCHKAFRNTD